MLCPEVHWTSSCLRREGLRSYYLNQNYQNYQNYQNFFLRQILKDLKRIHHSSLNTHHSSLFYLNQN